MLTLVIWPVVFLIYIPPLFIKPKRYEKNYIIRTMHEGDDLSNLENANKLKRTALAFTYALGSVVLIFFAFLAISMAIQW